MAISGGRSQGPEGHLGTSLEGHLEVDSGSILRSILGQFWTISRPYLRNLIETS